MDTAHTEVFICSKIKFSGHLDKLEEEEELGSFRRGSGVPVATDNSVRTHAAPPPPPSPIHVVAVLI